MASWPNRLITYPHSVHRLFRFIDWQAASPGARSPTAQNARAQETAAHHALQVRPNTEAHEPKDLCDQSARPDCELFLPVPFGGWRLACCAPRAVPRPVPELNPTKSARVAHPACLGALGESAAKELLPFLNTEMRDARFRFACYTVNKETFLASCYIVPATRTADGYCVRLEKPTDDCWYACPRNEDRSQGLFSSTRARAQGCKDLNLKCCLVRLHLRRVMICPPDNRTRPGRSHAGRPLDSTER